MITKDFGNGLSITTTGANFVECFEQMSSLQDIFDSCPMDGSNGNFKLVVRDVEKDGNEYRYYELWDSGTKAKKPLHLYKQKDKSGLMFVKKKDEDGNWLENDGWVVWKGEKTNQVTTTKSNASAANKGKAKKEVEEPNF